MMHLVDHLGPNQVLFQLSGSSVERVINGDFKKRRRRSARANPSLLRILLTCSRTGAAEILSGMRSPPWVYFIHREPQHCTT